MDIVKRTLVLTVFSKKGGINRQSMRVSRVAEIPHMIL